MKFIVKPKRGYKGGGKITLCAQCKENPVFCEEF